MIYFFLKNLSCNFLNSRINNPFSQKFIAIVTCSHIFVILNHKDLEIAESHKKQ